MCEIFYRHSWRQVGLLTAIVTTCLAASAIEARAVIIYSTDTVATRNLAAPSDAQGLDGWNLEATWGSFLATPIDSTHFICAQHIGLQSSTITFQGASYSVDPASRQTDPGSDLCVYSIVGGTFPTFATLYDESIDGSELNKPLTVIGRGTQPGSSVVVNGQPQGWYWGTGDGLQSWGQNTVAGYAPFSSDPNASQTALIEFDFSGAGAQKSILSTGDSSGGVFIQGANGQWKLAGINYSATGIFSYTGTGDLNPNDPGYSAFYAATFDARGLYYWDDATSTWKYDDPKNPDFVYGASFASSVSNELGWIQSVVPDVTVPEPGALTLLISGALSLVVFGRFISRRKAS